ncbi:hypothetical protein FIV00_03505 [Labrenzia sp. THAF82]|nr:hypothetical protein FIV00_03505 [Labrenzia sp. THAF82]
MVRTKNIYDQKNTDEIDVDSCEEPLELSSDLREYFSTKDQRVTLLGFIAINVLWVNLVSS